MTQETTPEKIHRANKKQKALVIYFRDHKKKLGERIIDWEYFETLLLPEITGDIIIDIEIINKTIGHTSLSADNEDFNALLRQQWVILKATETSSNKVKKITKLLETFQADHQEQENETIQTIDTVDK